MYGPEWGLYDVVLFTLFLAFVFVAVPVTAARFHPAFGVAIAVTELTVVAIYETGLVAAYKHALARLRTGDYRDDWQREQ